MTAQKPGEGAAEQDGGDPKPPPKGLQGNFKDLLTSSEQKLCGLVQSVLQDIRVEHEAELEVARALTSKHLEGRFSVKAGGCLAEVGLPLHSADRQATSGVWPALRAAAEEAGTASTASALAARHSVAFRPSAFEGEEEDVTNSAFGDCTDIDPDHPRCQALRLAEIWNTKRSSQVLTPQRGKQERHRENLQCEIDIFAATQYRTAAQSRGHALGSALNPSGFRHMVAIPSSAFNTCWRLMAILLLGFDCLTVPMTVFDLKDDSLPMRAMLYISVSFWTLDMPLSCVRGYINQAGDLEIRVPKVIKKYLRTHFLQDFALLVIEWVNFINVARSQASGFRQTSVMRVLKFMRLLKITKGRLLLSFLYRWLGSDLLLQMVSAPKVALSMLLAHHLMACGWHLVSGGSGDSDYAMDRYTMALQWSCSQMGFGWTTEQPANMGERIYAICVAALCIMMLTILIGAIVTEMARTQASVKIMRDQEARLRLFMRKHRISWALRNRIWTFLHKFRVTKKYVSRRSVELIPTLPGAITLELDVETYIPVLTAHPFFGTYAVSGVSSQAMRRLFEEHAIGEQSVVVEHELFMPRTPAPHMYFLVHGHLYYRATRGGGARLSGRHSARGSINLMFANNPTGSDQPNKASGSAGEKVMQTLRGRFQSDGMVRIMSNSSESRVVEVDPGDWLCEAALWLQWRHVGFAAAKTDCELVTLEAAKFQIVMHQELPEALSYARLFLQYASECTPEFNDVSIDLERLQDMAREVFEPPLFFDIDACRPGVYGNRSEWQPTDRKQWHVVWASPWQEGHAFNTSALISTLIQDMKHDVVLFYQTLFARNLPGAVNVQLSQEEVEQHDLRVIFLKRLMLCLALCRLCFVTEDNGLDRQDWPYPLASALCHGSRILVRLVDVSWKSFLNLLLLGEENAWAWEDGRAPAPIYHRRAATHGICMDCSSSELQEVRLHGVAALGSNHLGMDIPVGGLGSPTPRSSRGQLFVGPSGIPFRKLWVGGTQEYLKEVQHGHLYMRWDGFNDTVDAMSLPLIEAHKTVNSLLFGIESSAPMKQDLFGNDHGIDAVSKSVSAFGKRKWRDYRSGGQEVPADLGGMQVHVDAAKFQQLRQVVQQFHLCKPSDGCDPLAQQTELNLFQALLQSSDREAGEVLREHLDMDRCVTAAQGSDMTSGTRCAKI